MSIQPCTTFTSELLSFNTFCAQWFLDDLGFFGTMLEDVCMIFLDAFGSLSYTYMFLPNQHRNRPRLWVVRYPNAVGSLWHWKWRKDRTKPAGTCCCWGEKKNMEFSYMEKGRATWGWIHVTQKMRDLLDDIRWSCGIWKISIKVKNLMLVVCFSFGLDGKNWGHIIIWLDFFIWHGRFSVTNPARHLQISLIMRTSDLKKSM